MREEESGSTVVVYKGGTGCRPFRNLYEADLGLRGEAKVGVTVSRLRRLRDELSGTTGPIPSSSLSLLSLLLGVLMESQP